jgi:hypothetical protein
LESESKTANVVENPDKLRWSALRIARRIMKYAVQCALLVAMLIASMSWYRSYHAKNDLLIPHIPGVQKSFFLGVDRGTIYTGIFNDNPYGYPVASSSPFSPFDIEDSESSSKANDARQSPFKFGTYVSMRRLILSNYTKTSNLYVTFIQTLNGHGVFFPHCIAVIVLGTMFVFVTFGRRFTLRGLMIWITVVCLLMGIQIAAANYQPQQEEGVPDE